MRKLIYLGVVVALSIGVDVAARGFVESKVSSRAQQQAPEGSTASASIRGFPFIPRLLLSGEVSGAGVHLENLPAGRLTFAELDLNLHGVQLDRGQMFNDRRARITDIDRGTLKAKVTSEALSRALGGVPIVMVGTRISAKVAGVDVPLSPRVTGSGQLVLTGAVGQPLQLTIARRDYVPCVSDVSIKDGFMELSCEFNDIPPALVDAVQEEPV